MLNIPVVHREVIELPQQKLSLLEEIEYKQHNTNRIWKKEFEIEVLIKKNETDGMFTIQVKNMPYTEKQIIISINNKPTYIGKIFESPPGSSVVITSRELDNIAFQNVNTIAVALNARGTISNGKTVTPMWDRLTELNVKIKRNEVTNKHFLIDEKGLLIESYTEMSFKQRQTEINAKMSKSEIKIFPRPLVVGKHNVDMFYIQNISRTKVPWIHPNSIEGLKIDSPSKKNKVAFTKVSEAEDLVKGIIGNIYFDENTYYDFKDQKTYAGIGVNSKKGYVIPYQFKGDIIPILNLNIGSMNNLLIGFSNPIKEPYFDKENGIIKLKISESKDSFSNAYPEQNIILNQDFVKIISGDLTLEEIINLSKEKHEKRE